MSIAEAYSVTTKQADEWTHGEVVETQYGDGKVIHIHKGGRDPIVQARIFAPRSSDPYYAICPDMLDNQILFFTHEFGWELSYDYLYRLEKRNRIDGDIKNPELMALSPIEQEVLFALRRSSLDFEEFFEPPIIDQQGIVWCYVGLGRAKPRDMHGRDFIKQVRALQKAGFYRSHGSYELRRRRYDWTPNGVVRINDR